MKRSMIVIGVMLVACSMLLQAQAPIQNMSPIIGTWKVNFEKSMYFPGPRPAPAGNAQTRRYVDRGNGVIGEVRINATPAGAVAFNSVWSGKFDGSDDPVFNQNDLLAFLETGAKPKTTRSYKVAADPYTIESINKTDDKVNATVTVVVSRDGKTITETVKDFNAQGQQAAQNVVVYDRQ
jgi:hypothetical protein